MICWVGIIGYMVIVMVRHQIIGTGCSNTSYNTAGYNGAHIILLSLMVSSIFTDVFVLSSNKKVLILDDLIQFDIKAHVKQKRIVLI